MRPKQEGTKETVYDFVGRGLTPAACMGNESWKNGISLVYACESIRQIAGASKLSPAVFRLSSPGFAPLIRVAAQALLCTTRLACEITQKTFHSPEIGSFRFQKYVL